MFNYFKVRSSLVVKLIQILVTKPCMDPALNAPEQGYHYRIVSNIGAPQK